MFKLFAVFLSVLLLSCGGGGTISTAELTYLTVVPGQAVQHTSNGDMLVGPYRDLAALPSSGGKWVYVYDELFWKDTHPEQEVVDAALALQAKGLLTAVSILPEIVLSPEFKLLNPNAYNVIGIDIYPSLGIDWNTQGCKYNDNLYTTMLKCSIDKLRTMGFTGEIWYIYQDFQLDDKRLVLQKETIAAAPGLGATGLVAYRF